MKNWTEINDESREVFNTNIQSQIIIKTTMLKYILCDYSDAYILAKGTVVAVTSTALAGADAIILIKK